MVISIETLPAYLSVGVATLTTASIFVWRYIAIRKDSLAMLFSLPTIGIAGQYGSATGKVMESMAMSSAKSHMFMDKVAVQRIESEKGKLQIVGFPPLKHPMRGTDAYDDLMGKFDSMKRMLFVVDFSKSGNSIKSQINAAVLLADRYPRKEIAIVALDADKNKDRKNLNELASKFGRVHHMKSMPRLKKGGYRSHIKNEQSDLRFLINDLRQNSKQVDSR